MKALYHPLDKAVTIFLLLERINQVVANSLRRSVCSKHVCFSAVRAVLYDQDSVRGFPTALAAARRTSPTALPLSVPRRRPPDVVFKRVPVAMRAHVRQGDSSLSFNWHDDPPHAEYSCAVLCRPSFFLLHLMCSILSPSHLSIRSVEYFQVVNPIA